MGDLDPSQDSLRTYVQVLRRRFYWILAFTVLAVAIAAGLSAVQSKKYSATTQLLVSPSSGTVPISGTQATVSPTDVLTELQLITSAPVKELATKRLGFEPSITAVEIGQTNVIGLTATAPTPAEAAKAANAYARAFVSNQRVEAIQALTSAEGQLQTQIKAIDNELAPLESEKTPSAATSANIGALTNEESVLKEELAQLQVTGAETPGGVEIVSIASPPQSPSSPKPLSDGLIGLAIGLVLGITAAFAAEYFDDKVYTKDQVERLTNGVPVLAMVPKVPGWKKSDRTVLITELDPFSAATEAYRSLRTSMQFAGHSGKLKTILITSATGSEGKSSTVANLAVVLAKAGERVVVVGCDLRRPRICGFFGCRETPGLTNVLLGHEELKQVLQPVANNPGLALLPTGMIPPNPAELLASEKAVGIFRMLAQGFDTVLIDSPPLLPVADSQILASYADAILLVVAVGDTSEAELARANELLGQVGARPTGVVMNKIVRHSGAATEYGYGYGYKYRYAPQGFNGASTNGHARSPQDELRPERRTVL